MKHRITLAAAFAGALFSVGTLFGAENAGCRIDFSKSQTEKDTVSGWTYKGKPGTDKARFSIITENGVKVLKAESVNGTGSILFDISKIDFKKYPVMRWKWKVDELPSGADGRSDEKDDQAIGIYVGAGRWTTNSVAFRWETETPKKAEGEASYGLGMVSVKWHCVRNKEDKTGVWYVDECNIYEALDKRFKGKIPTRNVALSISCNSQYTKSRATAYLEYVEFLPARAAQKTSK